MAKREKWETDKTDAWAKNIPQYRDASGRTLNTAGDVRPQSAVTPRPLKGIWDKSNG